MEVNMDTVIETLKTRFNENMHRHPNTNWEDIETELNEDILSSIKYMEDSSGEPDIYELEDGLYFIDASPESPMRRSTCYDRDARVSRKKNAPETSALELVEKHKLEILSIEEYRFIQSLDDFDQKTSTWVLTPDSIREKGGALFGDKRYGETFIYHNGADSYYGSRGFRAKVKLS